MATTLYEVTARALNLRAAPEKTARVLTVLARGDRVVAAQSAPVEGWLEVVAQGRRGHAAIAFLRPLAPAWPEAGAPALVPPALPGGPVPAVVAAAAAAVDVKARDRDLARLHPRVRQAVQQVLDACAAEGLAFRVFEACRSPERQDWLYAQGRTRPGGVVTKARAWQSFHQYGMAVDFVLFEQGQWSWDDSGPRRAQWQRLQALIAAAGLRTLSWEMPHAEWPTELAQLQRGQFPDGGDDLWHDALEAAALRWPGTGAPEIRVAERPAMPLA